MKADQHWVFFSLWSKKPSHSLNVTQSLFGFTILGFLKRIPDLKILRIYGQEVERKVFPIPDQVTQFRSKRISAQLKADEELQDVSLHHVIRSAECPFAEELKECDEKFKTWPKNDCSSCAKELRKKIKKFNEVKSLTGYYLSWRVYITVGILQG